MSLQHIINKLKLHFLHLHDQSQLKRSKELTQVSISSLEPQTNHLPSPLTHQIKPSQISKDEPVQPKALQVTKLTKPSQPKVRNPSPCHTQPSRRCELREQTSEIQALQRQPKLAYLSI